MIWVLSYLATGAVTAYASTRYLKYVWRRLGHGWNEYGNDTAMAVQTAVVAVILPPSIWFAMVVFYFMSRKEFTTK